MLPSSQLRRRRLLFFQILELVPLAKGSRAPYTLVVIDCQPGFQAASEDWLQASVMHRIEIAVSLGAAVILVELCPAGNKATFANIQSKYAEAAGRATVSKYVRDASPPVRSACEKGGFPTSRFELCGVNTELCVYGTALGLLSEFPEARLDIACEACNTESSNNPWDGIQSGLRNKGFLGRCNFLLGPSPKNKGPWAVK